MKTSCLLLLAALGISMLTPPTATAGGHIEKGILFPSQYVEKVGVSQVYLPDGYDTSGLRYPVVYNFHGFGQVPGQGFITTAEWDRRIDAGEMPPVIAVMTARRGFGTANSDAPYHRHIAEEVVPYIDAHYRTIPRREARAVTGYSLGGRDAWEMALLHPEVFRLVSSYGMGGTRGAFPGLLRAHQQHHFPLEFWDYKGRRDAVVGSISPLMDLLDSLAMPHTFVEDGGNHDNLGETINGVYQDNPLANQIYFARRLWEEVNATAPYPIQRITQEFNALSGESTVLAISIHLQVQDEAPALTLDGSSIGLSADLPLTHAGDGRYAARLEVKAPARNGAYYLPIHLHIDGRTEVLRRIRLGVYPNTDQVIFADALTAAWGHNTRVSLATEVFDGTNSLAAKSGPPMQFGWTPAVAPVSLGYKLRLAFHPGTATGRRFNLEYEGAFGHKGNVDLLAAEAPAGQGVNVDEADWQILDIPLKALESNEPVQYIGFSGTLSGTFYLAEVALIAQSPPPDPAPRTFSPALHFVDGTEDLPAVVDQIPTAVDVKLQTITRVDDIEPHLRLDGTSVGADVSMPLTYYGNGLYTTSLPLDPNLANGTYRLPILMDSESHGTELFASLRLQVYPDTDQVIYAETELEDGVEPGLSFQIGLDPQATDLVFAGQSSLSLTPKIAGTNNTYFTWTPEKAVFGYSLRLAFHPGQQDRTEAPPILNLQLNSALGLTRKIPLLGSDDAPLDLSKEAWQVIEIPLGDQTVQSFYLESDISGTFYLDDIRLVPQTPPAPPTAVFEQQQDTSPTAFTLGQNYPNPFNSGTVIRFGLPQTEIVKLHVFNLAGQQVATLLDGTRPAGTYQVQWDGRDDQERPLASGIYLYRLQTGEQIQSRKLVLLR